MADREEAAYTLKLTATMLTVLVDMCEEWADKSRHGELKGSWGYSKEEEDAASDLWKAAQQAGKRGVVIATHYEGGGR